MGRGPEAWLPLLVALPALLVLSVLLVRRQTVHPILAKDAVNGRPSDGDLMEPLKVVGNLRWTEVVVLAWVQNLADLLPGRGPRGVVRSSRAVPQTFSICTPARLGRGEVSHGFATSAAAAGGLVYDQTRAKIRERTGGAPRLRSRRLRRSGVVL